MNNKVSSEPVRSCHGAGARKPGVGRDCLQLKAPVDSLRGLGPDFHGQGFALVGIESEQIRHLAPGPRQGRRQLAMSEGLKTPRFHVFAYRCSDHRLILQKVGRVPILRSSPDLSKATVFALAGCFEAGSGRFLVLPSCIAFPMNSYFH